MMRGSNLLTTDKDLYDFNKKHHHMMIDLCYRLDLPHDVSTYAMDLWMRVLMKVPRTPARLAADCVYVIAHLTGMRRSIKAVADASKLAIGYRVRVMPADKRESNKRWVQTTFGKEAILAVIDDQDALVELLSEYPSQEEE